MFSLSGTITQNVTVVWHLEAAYVFHFTQKGRSVLQCFPGERAARNAKNVLQEETRSRINCVVLIFGVFIVAQYIKKTLVWIGSRQSHLAFLFLQICFFVFFFWIFSDLSKEGLVEMEMLFVCFALLKRSSTNYKSSLTSCWGGRKHILAQPIQQSV